MNKNTVKILVVVLCLAVAGFMIVKQLTKKSGGPSSTDGNPPLIAPAAPTTTGK